jgi:diguanylate cyclase (GGDEF)-like protein
MDNQKLTYYLVPDYNAPEIQLKPDKDYTIGRSPENSILLTDNAVSRHHARLEFSENTFILKDLQSSNGTLVNKKKISAISLATMDELTFGRISFTFKIKESSESGGKTLSPEDTRILDEDLKEIIKGLDSSPLKKQLLDFQQKLNKQKKSLLNLAFRDDLTGLYNRRYFDKMLSTELKRAIRYKKVLILIMVDIDHFKKFNDTFGHQKGDSVLRTVGTILKENSRSSDIVCRYGGEEMAIILPEQDMNQGITTAEKLRKKLESEAYEIEGVNITASFGVGSTGVETKTIEELIKKSDEALYLAKKSGRNCTKAIN